MAARETASLDGGPGIEEVIRVMIACSVFRVWDVSWATCAPIHHCRAATPPPPSLARRRRALITCAPAIMRDPTQELRQLPEIQRQLSDTVPEMAVRASGAYEMSGAGK